MKWKIALAILGIAVVSAVLFAATVSAFTPNANSSNSPTSTNGPYRFGPHWFDDDSRGDFGEGGMMNGWGHSHKIAREVHILTMNGGVVMNK
jgi:hypothetical protein